MFSGNNSLMSNGILLSSVVAWAIAQTLKLFTTLAFEHKLDWSKLVSPGGMPSSHSAFVTGLATGVGLTDGWDSSLFAVSVVLALVVMYDAAGVRRAAGKQARVLNQIVNTLFTEGHLPGGKLRELLGHTPFEVFMGALLGVLTVWLMLR